MILPGRKDVHFVGTPEYPDTSQIDVAAPENVGDLYLREHRCAVVVWVVVVPLELPPVDKAHDIREIVVIVDDEPGRAKLACFQAEVLPIGTHVKYT